VVLGGIIGRSNRNQRKSEEEFSKALKSITNKVPDITLLHQGPDDPLNEQFGQSFIREYLTKNGCGIVLFGHCHWDNIPYIKIGDNQILNVDNRLYLFTE
jgi:Icc protein